MGEQSNGNENGNGNGNATLLNVVPFRMSICSKWMLKSTLAWEYENEKKTEEKEKDGDER